ncbi:phosphatidylinositol-specific phospholipase C [Fulvivirgaceae bacterium BMA12]|uniref:1-phosphatidylinositol phosphodiesterase n=1 Tax=Agaribacillus aureus TaxID=3051825 RepID=A0ABT8L544_9BACT|nr:phosphatidylinositol-specific phospholipase C [Fulvivirgaceae bacterium BMA12]
MKSHLLFSTVLVFFLLTLFSCEEERIEPQTVGSTLEQEKKEPITSVSYTLSNWMSAVNSGLKLSAISIPGTHDSGARFDPPIFSGTAKCQDLTIDQQLNAGTRFLDVRCRHIDNSFTIHHGAVYQNLNFDDVLTACFNFLTNNPSECIIMSVKEEHTPQNNTRSFEATFDAYVQSNPGNWILADAMPTLGSVRGKVVLFRRFGVVNTPKGINATAWSDNTTFEIANTYGNIKIQDNYVVPDNNQKWNAIEGLLNEASSASTDKLFINFTSGYKPGWFGIPNIPAVSNAINPQVEGYFTPQKYGRYGVVVMDFANVARNQLIVDSNFP